jgi:peptide/nickel transport system permease protein
MDTDQNSSSENGVEISINTQNDDESIFYSRSFKDKWRTYKNRFRQNYTAVVGLLVLAVFAICAIVSIVDDFLFSILGFYLLPYKPTETLVGGTLEPISLDHWGAGLTLRVSVQAGLLGISIGTIFGIISGYFGGYLDTIISMVTEILLAIPGILLALAFLTILGGSLDNLMIAIGISSSPYYVRIIRSETIVQRELTYVKAAKVLGASSPSILFKHIFPNILGLIITYGTLGIGSALLCVTALSFLELGAPIGTAEWGLMIAEGRDYLHSAPHMIFFPGMAILLTALSFNLVGDGLQEALNPRFEE